MKQKQFFPIKNYWAAFIPSTILVTIACAMCPRKVEQDEREPPTDVDAGRALRALTPLEAPWCRLYGSSTEGV